MFDRISPSIGNQPLVQGPTAMIRWSVGSLFVLLLCANAFGQETNQEEWKKKLQEKRIQSAQQQPPAQDLSVKKESPPATADKTSGSITINGKVITTKKKKTAPSPIPAGDPATQVAPPAVQPASGAIVAATAAPAALPKTAPVPTPALVKIKKTKIVGGKILTVEVEVTPTPGPISSGTPSTATAGPVVAAAPLPQATGYQLEVMKKLEIASNSPTASMRFDNKMIATLRAEFMKNKEQPHVAAIMTATESMKVLSDLQRLSSIARGGNIDKQTASKLLKVLFPTPPNPVQASGQGSGSPVDSQSAAPPPNAEAPSEQQPAPATEAQQQPRMFVDPQTGQYYYEDGTPVYPVEQQGQYYYDEKGNLFYELNGQVYFEKDGQFYPLNN